MMGAVECAGLERTALGDLCAEAQAEQYQSTGVPGGPMK